MLGDKYKIFNKIKAYIKEIFFQRDFLWLSIKMEKILLILIISKDKILNIYLKKYNVNKKTNR